MNWDQIEGKWKQSMGKVKEKWGKLTDDDLTVINGKKEQLVGKFRNAMELRRTPPRSRSMSLRGPTAQASRQEQRLSRPEWTRNVPKEECGGKIREGCWQKREERHAPRKARDTSFGQRR